MRKLIFFIAFMANTIIAYCQTNFYSTAAGDLDLVTSWGTNADGTGTNPTDFTTASQIFNIRNRATATIGAAWTVSGGTSKIIVGDGVSACDFIIPASFAVTGTVDVNASATLTIQNSANPSFGTLNATSTVVYNGSGSQTIAAVTYADLVLSGDHGGGTITLENGTTTVSKSFNVSATNIGSYITGTNTFRYTGTTVTVGGITYNNLTFTTGGAGTRTADGDITVNGTLTTTSGTGIFSMSFFQLMDGGSMSVTNNGRISTASTANPAMPAGKTWTGTTGLVTFANTSGGQFIPTGTYKTLTCTNTSGTNTVVGGDLTLIGMFTTSAAGGTLDMGTNALVSSSTITNNGTLQTQNTSSLPIPTGKTIAGTVEYNGSGSQTLVAGTFTNLALSGDHGGGTITLENGTISVSGDFDVTASNIGNYATGTNLFRYTGNTARTVGGITYNDLTFTNTSQTKTADGDVTVNGALTTTSGTGVFNLSTFSLFDGGSMTVTNNGRISTSSTNNPAIPLGENWTGTTGLITFGNASGGQFIPTGTYKTLTSSNTSGTNTVVGGDLTLTGIITTSAAGGTLDLGTNVLISSSTVTNTGTLLTQNTSAAPLPTGKTWAGTVNYNAASGGQTIAAGTYTTLTLDNTTGTNTAEGNLTVNTALNVTNTGTTMDMSTFTLLGTLTTITNNGLITTDNISATPFTSGKTWGGTGAVRYNVATGGQTIMAGTYNDLTLLNSSGTNTATNDITVNGILTTTAGGTFNFPNAAYQLLGASMTVSNSGTIQTICNVNPAIPAGKTWGGTIILNATTGAQELPAGTYSNVTFGNTSGTNTAVGDLQIDGALVTTSGGTLAMGTNQMTGALTSVTHDGTITTNCTSNPALPSGKDWSGTGGTSLVSFAATTGNQFIPTGTYKTLTCANTSNTNTVVGGDLTLTGVITTSGTGGTLDMGTNLLVGATSITNTGTIQTQNTSSAPLPTGLSWAGTVDYNAATGGQTVVIGTYTRLMLDNTSGIQSAEGDLTVNTALTISDPASTLDMSTFALGGTLTTITNNGLITTDNIGATPVTSGKTWGGTGTVRYNVATGGQTIMAGTYNDLTLLNSSGTNMATNDITVNGTLTTTAGGTFDFPNAGYQLLGASMTANNNGTIQTICNVNPAIPAGKTWGGTIIFNATTGTQELPAGTYNNVTFGNTSGTNTAVGDLQIDGALVTTSGGILALGTNQMTGALTSVTHDGTITTTCTLNPALPSGKDWSGTGGISLVSFAATTGNQFIPSGTYKTLTCANTSNTNTATGDITVSNALTTTAGVNGTLDMGTYQLLGTFAPTNTGTLLTGNTSSNPIPSGLTWAGTINYGGTGNQTMVAGTFTNIALTGTRTVSPTITLENGSISVSGNFDVTTTGVGSYAPGTNSFTYTANANRTVGGITYNDLTFTNTANNKVADGNVTVNGALTTTSGTGVFDMATYTLSGALTTITNNGRISTNSTNNPAIPSGKDWTGTTGLVTFANSTGGQFIPAGTYKTLTCSNLSGTNTAVGTIVVSGTFTTAGAGGTLDMGTNAFTATTITNSATSTIRTQNTSAAPIPSGKSIGGTVQYDAATGGQTIVTETSYQNLTLSNSSGTNSASGNIVVNGTLTTGSGTSIFDLTTFTLTGNASFSPAGGGTITTQNTSASPVKTAQTWTQLIEYNRAAGGQTIVNGTYDGGLSNSNTSGTNTVAAGAAITVTGNLTLSAGSTLADNNTTITVNGNVSGTGTHNTTASGKIAMTGSGGTISAATLGNLELNNDGGFSLAGSATVNGTLTLTSGRLFLSSYNLTLGTTAPAITGSFSSSNMIGATTGQLRKLFSGTGSYTFPIGDMTPNYSPVTVDVLGGTAGGSAYVGVFVRNYKHANNSSATDYLNRYWDVSVSGFTSPVYSLTATYVPGDVAGTETSIASAQYTGSLPWVKFSVVDDVLHTISATGLTSTGSVFSGITGTAPSVSVLPTTSTVCSGGSVSLDASGSGDPTLTYTWSPSTGLSATTGASVIASPTTGVTPTEIVYTVTITDGNGFTATATSTVTVNTATASITGTASVCEGFTTTLSDADGGGVWSSSDGLVATVDGAGLVTGADAGTATISYVISAGCYAIQTVTVNTQPGAIIGTAEVCIGTTSDLDNAETGGIWTSSNPATVDAEYIGGLLTGLSTGTATITYSLTNGCYITTEATTNPLPSDITGTAIVCAGFTTTLNDAYAGGTWSSANGATATVGSVSGIVSGVAAGVVDISYTFTATGCYTTKEVTVTNAPGTITGTASVCVDANTSLDNADVGGTWSSSTPSIATIGSASGIVTGVAPGNATITYTISAGCYITADVTVNPLADPGTISGTDNLNAGDTFTFTSDGTGGGTWSASNANATVSPTGLVTGVSLGSTTISYSVTNGCGTQSATYVVNTNTMALPITGAPQTCVGYTTQLVHAYTGGTWSSSDVGTATVGSGTGMVTGVAYGVVTITYFANSTYVTVNVLVNSYPPPISGSSSVCEGYSTTLSHSEAGGTWESSNVPVATVNSSGLVSGISTGEVVITYTVNSTCHITKTLSVNVTPGATTGASDVCVGASIALSNSTPTGYSWTSSNTSVGTIAASGIITGISAGTTTITYTTTTGCFTTKDVTVDAIPDLSGTLTVCATATTTLTPTIPGGIWSSSTAAATVGTTGVVTGVAAGTTRITYTSPVGCYVTKVVSVYATPAAITGTTLVCIGNTVTLGSATPGCAWSSSTPSIASVGTNGVVTGVAAGTSQISYSNGFGCRRTTYVTVNAAVGDVTGTASVCVGLTTTLSSSTLGGVWSGSNPTIAVVNSSGVVTGKGAGNMNISYTISAGCKKGVNMTVNALPAAITGTANACIGFTSTLSDATVGGAWSSSNAAIASVDASGVVTAVAAGTCTITYTAANTCRKTVTFTSKTLPASLTGVNFTCVGSFCTLFCPSGSGLSWSTSNAAIATVDAISGDVTGVSAGTADITFTNTSSCYTTRTVTINTVPDAGTISGLGTVIIGNSITLSNPYTYGAWTTSDAGVATVADLTISSATVTGVSAAVATITYTVNNGCGSAFTTHDVSVTTSKPGIHNDGSSVTLSDGSEVSLYPNPTVGNMTLLAPRPGKFYIITVDGKQTAEFAAETGKNTIVMPKELAAGIYMCKYVSDLSSIVVIRVIYEP